MCLPIYQITHNGSRKSKIRFSCVICKRIIKLILIILGNLCSCRKFERNVKKFKQPRKKIYVRYVITNKQFLSQELSNLKTCNHDLIRKSGYVSSEERNKSLEALFEDISLINNSNSNDDIHSILLDTKPKPHVVSARDIVLRRCGQTDILPFEQCYPNATLKNCHKIGEGVYGEAFLFRNQQGGTSVMKIIPIEGDQMVNGEKQKKFEEIMSEIIIAEELSKLKSSKINATTTFCEVKNIQCVRGKYPERLLDLWELYDEDCGSENDSPAIFNEQQLYVVFEFANGGKDLEAFVFNNALQAFSVFKQTVCALAVAEKALQFEHRDLHWGNILITKVDEKKQVFNKIDGFEVKVPTYGVEISLIDFTMSRITYDGVCIYNDLGLDPDLFNSDGDYQFDIYKLMQKRNGNKWQHFEPYTNILWLHYILDKMINGLRYKVILSKTHKRYMEQLKNLKEEILNYKSVSEYVESKYV